MEFKNHSSSISLVKSRGSGKTLRRQVKRTVARLHLTTAVYHLRTLNKNPDGLSFLPPCRPVVCVHQPPLTPVISRRFKKRGKGWPTAFCRALFNPAGDPRSLSTLPPLLSPRTLSCALLFLSFTAFCAALHCVFFYEVMRSR